jgi:hypothetical protein
MTTNNTEAPPAADRLLLRETPDQNIIEVELSGKIDKKDYELFAPELDRLIQRHGKIRVLVIMRDFHGWRMGALWQDIKFDLQHFKQFEKIAFVGEKKWQEWMSNICLPFTTGEIRYFRRDRLTEARAWLQSNDKVVKKAA